MAAGNWPVNPRPAKSLVVFRDLIDRLHPNRNKISDGLLGDPAHAATGSASDHNPWVTDSNGVGVVTAIDITHDPENGVDIGKIAEILRLNRDPRIKYVIAQGKAFEPARFGWGWQKYEGDNPHDKHLHLSVNIDNYDDTRPWVLEEQEVTTLGLVESLYRELLGRPDKDGHPVLDAAAKAYVGQPFDKVYEAVVNSPERRKYLEEQRKKIDDATRIAEFRDKYLKLISKALKREFSKIEQPQVDELIKVIEQLQDDAPIAEQRDKYLKRIAKAQGFDFKVIEEAQVEKMEDQAKLDDTEAKNKVQEIKKIVEE